MLGLHHSIAPVLQPVARIEIVPPREDFLKHRDMRVPQRHEIQLGVRLEVTFCPVLKEPGSRQLFFQGFSRSVFGLRDPPGHPASHIRVEPTEREARQPPSEDEPEDLVAQISSADPVPMREKDLPSQEIQSQGILVELHPDLVPQETPPPPIVVSTHEEDW